MAMESGGSMPHSQGLFNNPYPELNQLSSSYCHLSLRSALILSSNPSNGLLPVGLPVKILKTLLPSSILSTWHAHLNILDLITLTILGEWYKL